MLAFRNDRFAPSGTDGSNPLSSTGESDANLTSSGHAHTQERHRRGPSLAEQVADQLMAHDAIGAHARDELGFLLFRRGALLFHRRAGPEQVLQNTVPAGDRGTKGSKHVSPPVSRMRTCVSVRFPIAEHVDV